MDINQKRSVRWKKKTWHIKILFWKDCSNENKRSSIEPQLDWPIMEAPALQLNQLN